MFYIENQAISYTHVIAGYMGDCKSNTQPVFVGPRPTTKFGGA